MRGSTAVAVGVGAGAALAACDSGDSASDSDSAAASKPSAGGQARLAIGEASPKDNLDPRRQLSSFEILGLRNMYDGLTVLDDKFEPQPALATSWESSDDLKEWTFHLRDGIEFHDGSPMTAKDVVYTFQIHLDPKGPSPVVNRLGPFLSPDNVKAVDKKTVRIKLDAPFAFLPQALGDRFLYVVRDGQTDFKKPIGTGAFVFESFEPGQSFKATKNPNYWQNGKPYLDRIEFVSITETAARIESLLAKQVDIADNVEFGLIPSVQKAPEHDLLVLKNAGWGAIVMDTRVEPFTDPRVIRAMKLSVDRQQIVDTAYNGAGSVAYDTPIPQGDPYYDKSLEFARDIDQAKELLKDAGFPNGLKHELLVSPLDQGAVPLATAVKEQVAEAGIHLDMRQTPAATFWSDIWLKKSLYQAGWFRRIPDEIFGIAFTCKAAWNEGKFCNDKFDQLAKAARNTADLARQKEIYLEAQKILQARDGHVNPAFTDRVWGKSKTLDGVVMGYPWYAWFGEASYRQA